jgi:hypothetical protein
MKTVLMIIAICTAFILVPIGLAVETDSTPSGETYTYFTGLAGKDIADSEAKNWSYDAKLIRICIPKALIVKNSYGNLEYYTTEYSYIYESDNNYFKVLINVEEYENCTARTTEINKEVAEKLEIDNKKPLDDWKVISWNAFKIASNAYNMSLERGDTLGQLYFETTDIKGVTTPVWYISIKNGTTGINTDYMINANTGDIIAPDGVTITWIITWIRENIEVIGGVIGGVIVVAAPIIYFLFGPGVLTNILFKYKEDKKALINLLKEYIAFCEENSNESKINTYPKDISGKIQKIIDANPKMLADMNILEADTIGKEIGKLEVIALHRDDDEFIKDFYKKRAELVKRAKRCISRLK